VIVGIELMQRHDSRRSGAFPPTRISQATREWKWRYMKRYLRRRRRGSWVRAGIKPKRSDVAFPSACVRAEEPRALLLPKPHATPEAQLLPPGPPPQGLGYSIYEIGRVYNLSSLGHNISYHSKGSCWRL